MEHIGDFNRNPGHAASHIQILLGIAHRDHRKTVIELAAELQNPGHMQPDAFRLQELMLGIRVGDHDGNPVALLHVQRIRHPFTENDLLFAGFKISPRVILDKLRQRTQAAFLLRIDTLDLNGAHVATALHQPGEINVRRRGNDPFNFFHLRQRVVPVGPRLLYRLDFAMRNHRQNAVVQLTFKTVHCAEADDQHRHPERNPDG